MLEMDKLCCEVENKEILAFCYTKFTYLRTETSTELLEAQFTLT